MGEVLPNFFIVGAPKAGTTSLYHYLDQHPQVYMSPIKEPCYFASELRPANFSAEELPRVSRDMLALEEYLRGPISEKRFGGLVSEWSDYVKLFRNRAQEKAIGEASVCYLWSETAAQNIASKLPDAKIIMVLRNPVDRAFSQYVHALTLGVTGRSFRQQIHANLNASSKKFGSSYPFLEFGMYSDQVRRYLDLFGRDNVRICLYEEYQQDSLAMLAGTFRFLGVDAHFVPDMNQRHLKSSIPRFVAMTYFLKKHGAWRRVKELSPPSLRSFLRALAFKRRGSLVMSREDRAFLVEHYREDIRKLSALLDRDLSAWLD